MVSQSGEILVLPRLPVEGALSCQPDHLGTPHVVFPEANY